MKRSLRHSNAPTAVTAVVLCLTSLYIFTSTSSVSSQDKPPPTMSLVQFDDAIRTVASRAQRAVVSLEAHHKLVEGEQVLTHSLSMSGTVWDQTGRIITLGHGLGGAAEILVHLGDAGPETAPVKARLLGIDGQTGLALLKADFGDKVTALPVPPEEKTPTFGAGSIALCVGNPFGLNGSVRIANVAGVNRTIDHGYLTINNVIQVTAPVNPGDPGGLIVDARGYLRGIMISSLRDGGGSQSQQAISYLIRKLRTGKDNEVKEALRSELQRRSMLSSAQNIGFAIPVSVVSQAVERIEKQVRVPRVWLGVRVTELPESWREHFSKSGQLNPATGIMVIGVVAKSPAHQAGIQRHDIVVSWDGKEIDSPQTLQSLVTECKPEQKVKVVVIRGSKQLTCSVSLRNR